MADEMNKMYSIFIQNSEPGCMVRQITGKQMSIHLKRNFQIIEVILK